MGTQPPDRDDPYEDIEAEDLLEEPGLEVREIDDDEFRTPDGAYSDEPYDPAFQAVIEAGGGVAEGFEQSEAELPPDGISVTELPIGRVRHRECARGGSVERARDVGREASR